MNASHLLAAPRSIDTGRLLIAAPRPEFAAAFVESLNASLPGLGWISWAQTEHGLAWAEDFLRHDIEWTRRGEGLAFYVFERVGGPPGSVAAATAADPADTSVEARDVGAPEPRTAAGDNDRAGRYVGRIDLHSWDFDAPRCEVGYVGDVRCSGRGLMREAVLACVDLAFALGAARVQALSEAGNARAVRFAQHALGMHREGMLRNYERDAHGRLGEQVLFAAYNPRLG